MILRGGCKLMLWAYTKELLHFFLSRKLLCAAWWRWWRGRREGKDIGARRGTKYTFWEGCDDLHATARHRKPIVGPKLTIEAVTRHDDVLEHDCYPTASARTRQLSLPIEMVGKMKINLLEAIDSSPRFYTKQYCGHIGQKGSYFMAATLYSACVTAYVLSVSDRIVMAA